MSAQHTPGPWRWLGDHSLVGDHGRRPAVLTGRELRQRDAATGLLVPIDPTSPDALLMAAAPDLLATGESALRALVEMHRAGMAGQPVMLDRGAFDALEAAITKARGGK